MYKELSETSEVRKLAEQIFRFGSMPENLFRSHNWEVFILLHELIMIEDDFETLARAAEFIGDNFCYVTSHDLERVIVADWSFYDWLALVNDPVWVNGARLFGASARWGMICTDLDFSVLAGVPAFMDQYAAKAGGREYLRKSFLDAVSSPGWFVPTDVSAGLVKLAGWDR